jgi:flagella basal body P-ring formation protein FlgA
MAHGDEGHCARIRTENGKVLCGMPVGERLAELAL